MGLVWNSLKQTTRCLMEPPYELFIKALTKVSLLCSYYNVLALTIFLLYNLYFAALIIPSNFSFEYS